MCLFNNILYLSGVLAKWPISHASGYINEGYVMITLGFPAEPGKPGDLNFFYPGPEIAWNLSEKVRKPGQNMKFSIKPGMLRYTTFQYYIQPNCPHYKL